MDGRSSGSASLVGPSGNIWDVDLIEQNDELYFDQGWPIFVRDNFIECGDLLVFRYDGELHFTVQLFDQSSCEKETAFHSNCSQHMRTLNDIMGKKRSREDAAASSDQVFDGVLKKIREISPECRSQECINTEQEADSSAKTDQSDSLYKCLLSQSENPCNVKLGKLANCLSFKLSSPLHRQFLSYL